MDRPPWIIRCVADLVSHWGLRHESRILDSGRALDAKELDWARKLGIQKVQSIRVKVVPQVPVPLLDFWFPESWVERFALKVGDIAGITLGYGIYIREEEQCPLLIAHELVHVSQYERLGGLKQFLAAYLFDCYHHGYRGSEIEQEAVEKSVKLLHASSQIATKTGELSSTAS